MKSIVRVGCVGLQRTLWLRPLALIAALPLLALAGCAVGPDFEAPSAPGDSAYLRSQPSTIAATGVSPQKLTVASESDEAWWHAFKSPRLDALVDEGLANNYDAASALEKLARARRVADAVRSERLPQFDLSAASGHTRYGAAFLGEQAKDFAPYSYYAIGPSVTYDFDLFGRVRRSVERSDAMAEVQADELEATRLNVSGDIVNEVIATASIRERLGVLRSILVTCKAQQSIVRGAHATGGVSEVDIEQANRSIDDIEDRIAVEQQHLAAAQDALTVLVGKTPGTWSAPAIDLAELHLPQDVPLALPSALVRRRPDIQAAEARLHAQNAQIGVATANMYPDITLSGALSVEGLFAGPSELAWNALGGIAAPVFEGGRLRAQRQAAQADYGAALADYHQTVVKAFSQVADSLNALSVDVNEDSASTRAADSARRTEALDRAAYARGATGYEALLQATNDRQAYELKQIEVRGQRLADTARLLLVTAGPTASEAGRAISSR